MNEQEDSDVSVEAIRAALSEQMSLATLQRPMKALGETVTDLLIDLARFERNSTVALVAGLLTEPAYQSTTLRIELLIAFAVLHARGVEQPDIEDLARWFAAIGESELTSGEDPAEDVFVSLVTTPQEHFRMLEGLWESAGFYTQRVLEVLQRMPDSNIYGLIKSNVHALLRLSELACEKAGLIRYQTGSDARPRVLDLSKLPSSSELRQRVSFSTAELVEYGIQVEHLHPFILPLDSLGTLAEQEPGLSELECYPLLATDDGVVFALPTAVSTAVRDHVIDFALATRQIAQFNVNYAGVLRHVIADTALFASESGCRVDWYPVGDGQMGSVVLPFDHGYCLVLHFILPSITLHSQGRYKHPVVVPESLSQALGVAIRQSAKELEDSGEFREGLHLVVMCGWGQGMALECVRPNDPRWRYETISVADLIRLTNVESMSIERFWRLNAAERMLAEAGVELFNFNGVFNLFAWMEENGGHLVPHAALGEGRISPENRLIINPPMNLLRNLRAQADQSGDLHVRTDLRGKTHRLYRVNPQPYFPNPATDRVYGCLDCATSLDLVAACEGQPTLWLRVKTPCLTTGDTHFRLWDMVNGWGGQIVQALEERGGIEGSFELLIHFEDTQEEADAPDGLVPDDADALLRYEIAGSASAIIYAERGFLHAFRDPCNKAERALVRIMLRAVVEMAGDTSEPEQAIEEVMRRVVPNNTGRHFHVMRAQGFTDYVREGLPSKVLDIDDIDNAVLRLGLGWSVYDGPNDVEGVEACKGLLNRLVEVRVARVTTLLGELDRKLLIHRLLLNHEAAHAEELHWRRTSAAVIGLHGDSVEVRAVASKQLSSLARARSVSRILIEMAVCAAPITGGRIPADLEMQSLLAEVALLIQLGGWSDGIYFGALEPHVRISPLGDILVNDMFGTDVVEPMLETAISGNYVRSASNHHRYYVPEKSAGRVEKLLEPAFVSAWDAEMGFEIDQGRLLLDLLDDAAFRKNRPIIEMTRSALMELLATASGGEVAERFVDRFSLQPRAKWDEPPPGFSMREILPWRFGRRLSLLSRPLLQLDEADDPRYIISPGLVRSGFVNVLQGARSGRLSQRFFVSSQMRDGWWGQANEGHTFNIQVAEQLRDAGWQVAENVGLPSVLQKKLDRNYGDIDVLAWRHGDDRVFVIECKDLLFRRNYSEIAALLSDYRGELKNGKPDKLLRHLNRVDRLQQDIALLGRHTGIGNPSIVSCMVVGGPVPMQLASIPAFKQTFVGGVTDFLSTFGARGMS